MYVKSFRVFLDSVVGLEASACCIMFTQSHCLILLFEKSSEMIYGSCLHPQKEETESNVFGLVWLLVSKFG